MSDRVYCINCKLSCRERDLGPYYTIKFDDGGRNINHDTNLCKYNIEIVETVEHSYYEPQKLRYITVSNPYRKNDNNDCKDYIDKRIKIIRLMKSYCQEVLNRLYSK